MKTTNRRRTTSKNYKSPWTRALLIGVVVLAAIAGLVAILVLGGSNGNGQVAWTRFRTDDVHSLAFVRGDADDVLFGHHSGLSRSIDGGRTWSALPVRHDAMSMAPAQDGSIVIAGHEVFVASRDGGSTWVPIDADLPSLDIHGFTRDPGDPARMWAYVATGGLWESENYGTNWTRVQEDNIAFPIAVRTPDLRLIGVSASGLKASDDGGRSWQSLDSPPAFPVTALAATADGQVLYVGSIDGLFRSPDGGTTWTKTPYEGSALAVATTLDGSVVAVVSQATEFFRSTDGGQTWPGPR